MRKNKEDDAVYMKNYREQKKLEKNIINKNTKERKLFKYCFPDLNDVDEMTNNEFNDHYIFFTDCINYILTKTDWIKEVFNKYQLSLYKEDINEQYIYELLHLKIIKLKENKHFQISLDKPLLNI